MILTNARSITFQAIRKASIRSTPRTLLLTFDAFDTLFHPRKPVPEQYATTAHAYGLSKTEITPDKLKAAFKDVYRVQMKKCPNYGRADVLRGQYGGPRQWWEEVIRGSFALCAGKELDTGADLPSGLVDTLLNRFAGAEGYALYEDVAPFFARMRELKAVGGPFERIVVGVISNSDDRVPDVLKDLGLRVGDLRADQDASSMSLPGFEHREGVSKSGHVEDNGSASKSCALQTDLDLDMIITSYEAGEEKPSKFIFDVAERQARLLVQGSAGSERGSEEAWTRVHVGDDYQKDYVAAREVGWQSYLVRGNAQGQPVQALASLNDLLVELQID